MGGGGGDFQILVQKGLLNFSVEFNVVAKYNTRFIKKFSQLNSDIQSYRCKDFSLKQVSGLLRGSLWCPLIPFDILSTACGNLNTPIASYRCTF